MTNTNTTTAQKIKFTCRPEAEIERGDYTVDGLLLPDGRVIALNEAEGDVLLASVEAFSPNGQNSLVGHELLTETAEVTIEDVVAADKINTKFGGKSLLTNEEQLARFAAIGSDGERLVVWGIGRTREEAEAAALAEDAGDTTVIPCTPEAAALVRAGQVGCEYVNDPLKLDGFKLNERTNQWSADRLVVAARFVVRAHREIDGGTIEALNDDATLGDELHRAYNTSAEAEARAEEMQSEIADYGLDPRTVYFVARAD